MLAEQESDGAAFEQAVRLVLALLHLQLVGEVENGLDLGRRPVADAGEQATRRSSESAAGSGTLGVPVQVVA